MKKLVSIIVTVLLLCSIFVGCQTKNEPKVEATEQPKETAATDSDQTQSPAEEVKELEFVELKLWFVGDKKPGTDMVLEVINEKLTEKFNCTLTLNYMSWGDFGTKYPLLFASNDDFDGIFTADWAFYSSQAQKNGFLEITEDLLKEYAPNVYENTPSETFDQVKVNGKVFMIPQLQDEYNQRHFIVRGDLRKKYEVPEIKTLSDVTAYLEAVHKNEKSMTPVVMLPGEHSFFQDIVRQTNGWEKAGNNSTFLYSTFDITNPESSELFNLLDTPEYMEMLKTVRDWNEKGYISKSLLSNQTNQRDALINGKSALMMHNYGSADGIYKNIREKHPEWEVELFDGTQGQPVLPYAASGGGIGIHATSKNPERMLMVVDYLRYDKEANFLVQRGIKGVHWDIAGDGSDENVVVGGPKASEYDDSFTWGPWRNSMYQKQPAPEDAIPGYMDIFNSLKSRVVNHPLQSFTFDDTNVKNELAAIKSVIDQYGVPLEWGFVDPEEGLATYKEKLQKAGFDKVMEEMRTQAEAYVNSLK